MRICMKCHAVIEEDMMFCPECGAKYVIHDTQVYTAENCPVAIAEQNLITSDVGTDIVILFANIANETVNAVSVRLKCYDQLDDELTDTIVKYTDLSVENGEIFGADKIIIPADADTYSFRIILEKVLLEETGLIKTFFSDFAVSNNLNYLREQIDVQNTETIVQAEQARHEEEIIKKSVEVLFGIRQNWKRTIKCRRVEI